MLFILFLCIFYVIRWKKFDYELIIDALELFEERLDLAKYITEFNGENGFHFLHRMYERETL